MITKNEIDTLDTQHFLLISTIYIDIVLAERYRHMKIHLLLAKCSLLGYIQKRSCSVTFPWSINGIWVTGCAAQI